MWSIETVMGDMMQGDTDSTVSGLLGRLFPCSVAVSEGSAESWNRHLPAKGGVYALADSDGRLIQLLGREALRKVVTGRLKDASEGEAGRRVNLGGIARRIWWRPTYSVFETKLVHLQIGRQLLGPSYKKQLAFGPAWFASVSLNDAHPRWVATASGFGKDAVSIGPFETKARCESYTALLEDVFDLCRDYRILQQAPDGQACAYRDMGKCPAPCDGSISMNEYRRMLSNSASFANGDTVGEFLKDIEERMLASAKEMAYEIAGQMREKREKARKLDGFDGRMGKVGERFEYLVLQAGRKASTLRPFFLKSGRLDVGEDVHTKDIASAAKTWAEKMTQSDKALPPCDTFASECVSLTCHFLRKSDSRPGIYLGFPYCRDPNSIVVAVEEKLGRRSG